MQGPTSYFQLETKSPLHPPSFLPDHCTVMFKDLIDKQYVTRSFVGEKFLLRTECK